MKVELQRKNKAFHFEASNTDGLKVQIDGSPLIGGEGKGVRPMELLLMSLGGCASIDIVRILSKQRQSLDDYRVEISGVRNDDEAKAYNRINFHFKLFGNLEADKVEKAIHLTITKYCSAILSLDKSITIDYTYTIHEKK